MSENSVRNLPRQPRSQQTVDLILDTAAGLFVEIDYANTTTNAIAEKAGISIGTLYRYFPDKEAILNALAERYTQQTQTLLQSVFVEDAKYLPVNIMLDRLFDPYLELYRRYPVYAHILLGSDVSSDIAAVSCGQDAEFISRLTSFLQTMNPSLDEKHARRVATVSKGIAKMLISLVAASKDEQYQQEMIVEVKLLLLRYLEPLLRPTG
jgi:AcrR family transcriptional regulator